MVEVSKRIKQQLNNNKLKEAPLLLRELEDKDLICDIQKIINTKKSLIIKDIDNNGNLFLLKTIRINDILIIDLKNEIFLTRVNSGFVKGLYPELIKHTFKEFLLNPQSEDCFDKHFFNLSYWNKWLFRLIYKK